MAALAKQELAQPQTPAEQFRLADAWWAAGENASAATKTLLRADAVSWYSQALPKLTGLDQAKAEKRVEMVSTPEPEPAPVLVRGVVKKGNVALATNGATVTSIGQPILRPADLLDGDTATVPDSHNAYALALRVDRHAGQGLSASRETHEALGWPIATTATRWQPLDGKRFVPLVDRSDGEWRSWQRITFPARTVRAVKILGLFNSAIREFHVVEFEAYCIPPAGGR